MKEKKEGAEYSGRADEVWDGPGGSPGETRAGRFGRYGRHRGQRQIGIEKKCTGIKKEWKFVWLEALGFMGPFAGSVLGIMGMTIGAWLVNLFGLLFKSPFISSLAGFIFENLQWFFLAFLFFGYSDYAGKRYPGTHWIFSPVIASVGSVIVVWISVLLLDLINIFAKSSLITSVSNSLAANLLGIFVLVLVLGYALKVIHKMIMNSFVKAEQVCC